MGIPFLSTPSEKMPSAEEARRPERERSYCWSAMSLSIFANLLERRRSRFAQESFSWVVFVQSS